METLLKCAQKELFQIKADKIIKKNSKGIQLCRIIGCCNRLQKNKRCTKHGAYRKFYKCSLSNCKNRKHKAGYCYKHRHFQLL